MHFKEHISTVRTSLQSPQYLDSSQLISYANLNYKTKQHSINLSDNACMHAVVAVPTAAASAWNSLGSVDQNLSPTKVWYKNVRYRIDMT